jgi:hypothetical protein
VNRWITTVAFVVVWVVTSEERTHSFGDGESDGLKTKNKQKIKCCYDTKKDERRRQKLAIILLYGVVPDGVVHLYDVQAVFSYKKYTLPYIFMFATIPSHQKVTANVLLFGMYF